MADDRKPAMPLVKAGEVPHEGYTIVIDSLDMVKVKELPTVAFLTVMQARRFINVLVAVRDVDLPFQTILAATILGLKAAGCHHKEVAKLQKLLI